MIFMQLQHDSEMCDGGGQMKCLMEGKVVAG